jgi:mRNA-degrading endonuclease YafQ of YafQ-DinJ toxin-antitoxin module
MGEQYEVFMPKKFDKIIREMPVNARKVLVKLMDDIREDGPVQPKYQKYSKLGDVTYHCHVAYRWVACWRCENGKYVVEVEYVGSRENAPY